MRRSLDLFYTLGLLIAAQASFRLVVDQDQNAKNLQSDLHSTLSTQVFFFLSTKLQNSNF